MEVDLDAWAASAEGLLAAGGTVLVALLLLSIAGLAVVIVKAVQFARARLGDRRFVAPALNALQTRDADGLRAAVRGSTNPIAGLLHRIVTSPRADRAALDADLQWRAEAALAGLRRHLRLLDVVAQLSPLLGLLGTVLGMIQAFEALQSAGGRADPGTLAGGISQALVTTAAGLIIAIPASAALSYFEARLDRLRQDMETIVNQALDILEGT